MIKQNPLIFLRPVKKEMLGTLNDRLKEIKKQLADNQETVFKKLTTVHFARWVVLSRESFRDEPAFPIPVRLVFSSNYDGDEDAHLTELVTVLTEQIDKLYECCEGYPEPALRTTENRKNYLKQGLVETTAFYNGAPGRSLKQIYQEDALRDYIWEYINKNKWDGKSAVEIHRAVRQEIDSKPEFEWSKEKAILPKINIAGLAWMGLVILIFLPLIIIWILIVHFFYERRDKIGETTLSQLPDKHVSKLEEDEDLCSQNQFTQVVVMKPGTVRLITFKLMMLLGRTLIKNMFVKGELMGIPTIHFARWVLFDNNKHVLFFSNFDGSWQQYLGDFIDKSGWGLTGIFSNTVNFPKTNFLLTGGAYDEEHFLAWSRGTQVPTAVWYSAYPHLSIKNVMNNSHIRNELRENLSEKEAQTFLKRF
jgi:hypothetical protein